MGAVEDAIKAAAEAEGIDPATALAYAQRESTFNPRARASSSMRGLFQMSGALRTKYGVGDSDDVGAQVRGFAGMLKDNKSVMSKHLGRDVTDEEAYAGHHFGAGRAARMFKMDPNTPVDSVFTPRELSQNPHIVKAGAVGPLLSGVTGDIGKRRSSFGASAEDFSQFGEPVEAPDFSQQTAGPAPTPAASPLDFSQFGTPV